MATFFRFTLLTSLLLWSTLSWSQLTLAPNQVAIIGYGSLMNAESMSRSLGHAYTGPVIEVEIAGFQRDFTAVMPNDAFYEQVDNQKILPKGIAYFNLSATHNRTDSVNAVLFVVDRDALKGFDMREWIYDRVQLPKTSLNVEVAGEVMVYIAKPEYTARAADPNIAIRKTYLEIVENAVNSRSPHFRQRFNESTLAPTFRMIQDERLQNADPFGYNKIKKQNQPTGHSRCAGAFL